MATKEHVLQEFRGGELFEEVPWVDGDGLVARTRFDSYVRMFPSARVDYYYTDDNGVTRVERKPAQGWQGDGTTTYSRAEFDSTAERIEFHRPLYG